jgi:hypothetical protein
MYITMNTYVIKHAVERDNLKEHEKNRRKRKLTDFTFKNLE